MAGCAHRWRPIDSAPRDGSHFLAWATVVADEFDEDDRLIRKGKITRYAVVAYWAFGGFVEMPWRGSRPMNLTFSHWMPLPDGPWATSTAATVLAPRSSAET